jgi:hypothetical protein
MTLYLASGGGLTLSASSYDAVTNPSCGPVADDSRTLLLPAELFVPRWHHVVMTMDVSQQTRHIDAMIDDVAVMPLQVKSIRTTVPASVALAVGVPCVSAGLGCFGWDNAANYELMFDDVVLAPAK